MPLRTKTLHQANPNLYIECRGDEIIHHLIPTNSTVTHVIPDISIEFDVTDAIATPTSLTFYKIDNGHNVSVTLEHPKMIMSTMYLDGENSHTYRFAIPTTAIVDGQYIDVSVLQQAESCSINYDVAAVDINGALLHIRYFYEALNEAMALFNDEKHEVVFSYLQTEEPNKHPELVIAGTFLPQSDDFYDPIEAQPLGDHTTAFLISDE